MPRIRIKNIVDYDDDNEDYCEQPQRRQPRSQPQQQAPVFSVTAIPMPFLIIGVLAVPILTGMWRPTVIMPQSPVIVNNSNK